MIKAGVAVGVVVNVADGSGVRVDVAVDAIVGVEVAAADGSGVAEGLTVDVAVAEGAAATAVAAGGFVAAG